MSHALALPGLARRTAWRLRRLTRDRNRERLAAGICRVVSDAESSSWQAVGAAVPVRRRAVLGSRTELLELAERLRSSRPVYAQGVALVSALLTDACSPLYQSNGDLKATVEAASLALDGHLN